jgi:hypothetical protein
MVPLSDDIFMIDLIKKLQLSAARSEKLSRLYQSYFIINISLTAKKYYTGLPNLQR